MPTVNESQDKVLSVSYGVKGDRNAARRRLNESNHSVNESFWQEDEDIIVGPATQAAAEALGISSDNGVQKREAELSSHLLYSAGKDIDTSSGQKRTIAGSRYYSRSQSRSAAKDFAERPK